MARRFAVIGTGQMAQAMMPAFAQAGAAVGAIVSRNAARASAFAQAYNVPFATDDLGRVLSDQAIDAVYVATLPSEHTGTVIAALRAGKAVLCEKPLAVTSEDLAAISRASSETGVLCMEGLWTLHLPAYRRFLDDLRSERVGKAQSLVASFGYPTHEADLPKMLAPERGGVLLDRACYLIALALAALGPVRRVDAQLRLTDTGAEAEAFLLLEHEGGRHSQLAASFLSLMSNTSTLNCSHGSLELGAPLIGSELIASRTFRPIPASEAFPSSSSFGSKIKTALRQNPRLRALKRFADRSPGRSFSYGSNAFLPQLQHFISLLDARRPESDVVPMQLSTDIMSIVDQARRASRSRP